LPFGAKEVEKMTTVVEKHGAVVVSATTEDIKSTGRWTRANRNDGMVIGDIFKLSDIPTDSPYWMQDQEHFESPLLKPQVRNRREYRFKLEKKVLRMKERLDMCLKNRHMFSDGRIETTIENLREDITRIETILKNF
jgi:hypothetical protein